MKILLQINLVENSERRAQMPGRGVFRVVVLAIHFDLGVMGLKLAAEHFDIRRKTVECVAGRVHADERFARLDPVNERLFVRQREVAGRVGKDGAVVLLQRVGFHLFSYLLFGARVVHGKCPAGFSNISQDFFGGGNGTMPKPFGHGHNEKFFRCRCLRSRNQKADQRGCQQEFKQFRQGFIFHSNGHRDFITRS